MSTYEEWAAAQEQKRAAENQMIQSQMAEQGYKQPADASPTLIKWAAVAFAGLSIGVFLGPAALMAALIAGTVIIYFC